MTTTDIEPGVGPMGAAQQVLRRAYWPAPYDVVRAGLGLVLLAASAAKCFSTLAGGIVESGWLTSRWTLTSAAFTEAVFGLWLLSGLRPRLMRVLAAGFFLVLGAVALLQGLGGSSSCNCLGPIPVTPWQAVTFDCAAVLALLIFRPCSGCSSASWGLSVFAPHIAGALSILLVVAGVASYRFGSVTAALARLRGDAVVVVPTSLDAGEGALGEVRTVLVRLVNLTDHPIPITGSWPSCGCILLDEPPFTLPAGESRKLRVMVLFSPFRSERDSFARRVALYTNQSKQVTVNFWLTGRILGSPPEAS